MAGKKNDEAKVTVTQDGPYLVSGALPLCKEVIVADADGNPCEWRKGECYPPSGGCALCRCGNSRNQPYCDGTHISCRFNDGDASLKGKPERVAKKRA